MIRTWILCAIATMMLGAARPAAAQFPPIMPAPKISPTLRPAPPPRMLNNGSLYTFANPNAALPGQLPYGYMAVASQDCRLYHNGALLMPVNRLLAGQCSDMTPSTLPGGGFIPTYQSIFAQAGGGAAAQPAPTPTPGGPSPLLFPNQLPLMTQPLVMAAPNALGQQQAYQQQAMRAAAYQAAAFQVSALKPRKFTDGAMLQANQPTYFSPVPSTVMTSAAANPFAAFNVDRGDKGQPTAASAAGLPRPEVQNND